MGHDSHTVMSPAHRRNQNPVSPSASFFRRSSTFTREEPDLSWVALFRRHRFLLLTLALLAFLCTVYLYFAIKLGADSCSGLTGKDETMCRLEKMKGKTMHGHKRMMLNVQESSVGPSWIQEGPQVSTHTDFASWMNLLSEDRSIQSALVLGCTGTNLTQYLIPRFSISLSSIGCEERSLLEEIHEELPLTFLQMESLHDSWLFDLIICDKCSMLEFVNDESKFWKLDRLLRQGGFFVWILETTAKRSALSLDDLQLHGWSCLSRVNDIVLWWKL